MRVTDHRPAKDMFQRLLVTVIRVRLHPGGAPKSSGWVDLSVQTPSLDLVPLRDGAHEVVAAGALDPGAYDAVRLEVAGLEGTAMDGRELTVDAVSGAAAMDLVLGPGERRALVMDLVVLDVSDERGEEAYEVHVLAVRVD